jgi:hypothetical protein
MGSRFDAALSYVFENVLNGATVSLYTRAAENHVRRNSDAAAVMANWSGDMWVTVGGSIDNMSQEYRDAVAEGRSIWGRMGYTAVINRIIEIWDCTPEQAATIFGQMGYAGRVAKAMTDLGLSEAGARSHIGREGYAGRVNNVMRDHDLPEEEARSRIGMGGYSATILAIMGVFGCSIEEARSKFAGMGGKKTAEASRIKDDRKQCQTDGCQNFQKTLNNPLCDRCTRDKTKKIKSGEIKIEIKERRCIMCGESDKDRSFKGKTPYCRSCYGKPEGKLHRKQRKKELYVQCSESGCTCMAWKDGKCEQCFNGRH